MIQNRHLNRALWAIQVLLAATFLIASYRKLASTPESIDLFDRIGLGQWLRYAVGLLELALAAGIVIPRLSGAVALIGVGVMIGATATEVHLATGRWLFPLVVLAAAAAVAWARRNDVRPLLRRC